MKVNIKRRILIPHTPNFIMTDDKGCYPVSSFTRKELKQIGDLWTKELIKKAKKQKK